jgi:hypothetical protein
VHPPQQGHGGIGLEIADVEPGKKPVRHGLFDPWPDKAGISSFWVKSSTSGRSLALWPRAGKRGERKARLARY